MAGVQFGGGKGTIVRAIDDGLIRLFGLPWLRLTRSRWIHERCAYALVVMDKLGLIRPAVLDLGCGSGILVRYLATYSRDIASYTGVDLRASRLVSRYRGITIPVRFLDLDLDSNWHLPGNDLAWCSEVLEHLFDDSGALGRIAASVKPGGYVIVTMPSLTFLESVAKETPASAIPSMLIASPTQDGGHVRLGYTTESLHALAAQAGLDVVRVDAVSPTTPAEMRIWNRYRSAAAAYLEIERRAVAPGPPHVLGAGPEALRTHLSIAAVLRRPLLPAQ